MSDHAPQEPRAVLDTEEAILAFGRRVYRLSNEAFQLAQRAAKEGFGSDLLRQAREKERQLRALWPDVQRAATSEPTLPGAWSDGILDSAYVISNGQMSRSRRMGAWLRAEGFQ